jgi:tetratricopeptide (TPR) repeat protein
MQHVTAFSRAQTVPAVPAPRPKSSFWILNSWRDLILYVGTPLFLVPMFALAQARWSAQDIYVFVAAFGAMGHHLPGMIRAYGDPSLFARFRWRFIIAPIFLLATCVGFYWWDLKGIVLIVYLWGIWHGMMQTYGFCRIYDAKMGSFAALSRRLDFATCGIWFAAAVLLSSGRMTDVLDTLYASGVPFVPVGAIHGVQQGILVMAIAVAILFIANFAWMWGHGKRANPVKLALLTTSIAFWWYCNNGVTNILAGIALFEVFHDVQYLSLVWIYNRNRVEKDNTIGGFMRFVFRRSGSLIGLYIGLVFAYGSLAYFNSHLQIETIKHVLTGVVAASGLLHFYYDGFIWKVREKSTRQSLGLTGGTDVAQGGALPSWFLHGAKWAMAFVVPLVALCFGQTRQQTSELDRASWVVADLPNGARQHYNYGAILRKEGRLDEAEKQYHLALQSDPNYADAHINLADVFIAKSKLNEAETHFQKALVLEPRDGAVRAGYAYLLERLGRPDEAANQYETAIRLQKNSPKIIYNYAAFLHKKGKLEDAILQYRRALQADSNFADAHFDLGAALFEKGALEEAKVQFLETARLQPRRADVQNDLGSVFLQEGRLSQAIAYFEEALRLDPELQAAKENLRLARLSENRFRSRTP